MKKIEPKNIRTPLHPHICSQQTTDQQESNHSQSNKHRSLSLDIILYRSTPNIMKDIKKYIPGGWKIKIPFCDFLNFNCLGEQNSEKALLHIKASQNHELL